MTRLRNRLQNLSDPSIFFLLFLYGLFIRLPFFFRDYIDRDESSFILMGQSWVDGHLPFTELWDVKPPLTFLFFALLIYLFGKSFLAIRLAGLLLVTITAFYTYRLAKQSSSKMVALPLALLCVILQSLFGSLQGVMSEHLAMACLTPALWFMTRKKTNSWQWLYIGLLVGAALMIKLNLAYVGLFLGLTIIWVTFNHQKKTAFIAPTLLYGAGILLVFAFCLLPYALDDLLPLWWKSVIEAPLAYAGARTYGPIKLLSYLLPFVFILWYGWKKEIINLNDRSVLFILAATLGTLLAFIKSGRVNGHYLILIYPQVLALLALFFQNKHLISGKKLLRYGGLLLVLIPIESYLEYAAIVKHKVQRGSFFNGEGIRVPQYFARNDIEPANIYFTEYHIGYWLMDEKPVTKAATQPSNVLKDEMFFAYDNPRETGEAELQFILEALKPSHIVTRKNRRAFDKKEYTANFYLNLQLLKNYQVLDTVDAAIIFRRLPLQ